MFLAPSILIVEDDPKTAKLIGRFLSKEGFRTSRAADGGTAIDTFAAVGLDLVILDAMLPKVDGFEVCAVIRRTSKVPILFLTARTEEANLVLGVGLGADDYVEKPFSPRELVARAKRRFSLHGRALELTAIGFTLL